MARPLQVILAQPRGFCAGVVRAIDIVERAIARHGAPVYVRHEIVHNSHVVDGLEALGAVFVNEVTAVPRGAVTVYSAHGVSRAVEAQSAQRGLDVIDATCPLVQRVHKQGRRYAEQGYDVILIGHAGHPEVEGSRGQIGGRLHVIGTIGEVASVAVADPDRVAYVTQTTLSVADTRGIIAALTARFPALIGPDIRDICYATQNRQSAVLDMVDQVDALLVIGSANSSNSNRLREIAANAGRPSYLIDGPAMLDRGWLEDVNTVGITAGASAPECLVQATIARLRDWRAVEVTTMEGIKESVHFRLPPRLADVTVTAAPTEWVAS